MTPEDLADLHDRAMVHAAPWSARSFAEILASPASLLVTEPASSWQKYRGGRPKAGGQRPPTTAMPKAAQPIGFALGRSIADEAELLTLVVDPDHQGQGRGAALLARFETESRARGAATAYLEVAQDNEPAFKLYKNAGWTQAGKRPAYYPRGEKPAADALILRKPLTEAPC